jgi:hypothetical protein
MLVLRARQKPRWVPGVSQKLWSEILLDTLDPYRMTAYGRPPSLAPLLSRSGPYLRYEMQTERKAHG